MVIVSTSSGLVPPATSCLSYSSYNVCCFSDIWTIPWREVGLGKLRVTQLVKKYPAFMEYEESLPRSQESVINISIKNKNDKNKNKNSYIQ